MLLALAFGATNVFVLRRLPPSREGALSLPSGEGPSEPIVLPGFEPPADGGHTFDAVLRGGRVMDPDSGFDQVADVGIDATTIAAISPDDADRFAQVVKDHLERFGQRDELDVVWG